MDDFIHHLIHFLMYSLILWQVVLGVWIILIWASKNIKFNKTFSVMSPTENKTVQPVINIDGSSIQDGIVKNKKDTGVVDVKVDKNIFIGKTDEQSVKVDEKIKGKVKTQKDKLRELRK